MKLLPDKVYPIDIMAVLILLLGFILLGLATTVWVEDQLSSITETYHEAG